MELLGRITDLDAWLQNWQCLILVLPAAMFLNGWRDDIDIKSNIIELIEWWKKAVSMRTLDSKQNWTWFRDKEKSNVQKKGFILVYGSRMRDWNGRGDMAADSKNSKLRDRWCISCTYGAKMVCMKWSEATNLQNLSLLIYFLHKATPSFITSPNNTTNWEPSI